MKKIILLSAAFCFIAFPAFSQEVYLEGSLGLNYDNQTEDVGFRINPNIGFMISDNWALGFGLSGEIGHLYENYYKTEIKSFGVGFFAQNFVKISDRFYYTPRAFLGVYTGNMKYSDCGPYLTSESEGLFGLRVGISAVNFEFRASPKIGITLDVGGVYFDYLKVEHNLGIFSCDLNLFQTSAVGVRFHF